MKKKHYQEKLEKTLAYAKHQTTATGQTQHTVATKITKNNPYGQTPDLKHPNSLDDITRLALVSDDNEIIQIARNCTRKAFNSGPAGFPANYQDADGEFRGRDGIPDHQKDLQDLYGRGLQFAQKYDQEIFNTFQGKSTEELTFPNSLSLTSIAYSRHIKQNPKSELIVILDRINTKLITKYNAHSDSNWIAPGEIITYGATYPTQALLESSIFFEKNRSLALKSLDFLIENTFINNQFSPIGNDGWFIKNQKKASYSKQAIEAGAMAETLGLAYIITEDKKYLNLIKKTESYFHGDNEDNIKLVTEQGTVLDGIDNIDGNVAVNKNAGAESQIAYLQTLKALIGTLN